MKNILTAEDVNQAFDLLPIAEADTTLKPSGAWWIGPCPFCGGTDRFNLHHTLDGWRWFCRHCGDGRYHDSIAYMMKRNNQPFQQALETMGAATQPTWPTRNQRLVDLTKASEERQPTETWRARGRAFVETCRQNLWQPAGEKARTWLHARGFSDLTLLKYSIGFNPSDRFESLDLWGLAGDGKVALARGITIPCIGSGGLYSVKIRKALPPGSKDRKYVQVRGGRLGLFGHENMRGAWLAVITEGEFDCMILDQVAGDLAAICTMGSATDSPLTINPDLMRWFYQAAHTLAVFDNDEAGRQGTLKLQEQLPGIKIVTLPDEYKDINDAHLAGLDLAGWLCQECTRLGIAQQEAE